MYTEKPDVEKELIVNGVYNVIRDVECESGVINFGFR